MLLARRAVVLGNGLLTSTAAAGLLPGALAWPVVAEALARRHPGAVAWDAALCFGPLVVPPLIALGAIALRSAWKRDPDAIRWNGGVLAAWTAVVTGAVAGVGLG